MRQFQGQPAIRERREEQQRVHVSLDSAELLRQRRLGGDPAKYNTRSEERRIRWENDLYERQSI